MQTCFFALAGVLPTEEAIAKLKEAIAATYGKRGDLVVQRNIDAVDTTLASLFPVPVGDARDAPSPTAVRRSPSDVTEFVQRVTARILAGEGDLLPVSALPPGRHVPDRHVSRREADDRHGDPDLGSGPVHRLRQVRDRVPHAAIRHEGVRPKRTRRSTAPTC